MQEDNDIVLKNKIDQIESKIVQRRQENQELVSDIHDLLQSYLGQVDTSGLGEDDANYEEPLPNESKVWSDHKTMSTFIETNVNEWSNELSSSSEPRPPNSNKVFKVINENEI